MLALAHHYDELVTSAAGTYRSRVYGRVQEDGMWAGIVVFFPVSGGRAIATDRETTQSSLADLSYWASGLTHLYLHGALERALALQPEAQLARELHELERIETSAVVRADALEAAAAAAEADARLAGAARERTEERLLEAVADSAATDVQAPERAAATARNEAELAERTRRTRRSTPSRKRASSRVSAKRSTSSRNAKRSKTSSRTKKPKRK